MNDLRKATINTPPPTINIIGTGKLGRTLARLFYDSGLVKIGGIYNRTIEHSQAAIDFIGSGTVIGNIETKNSNWPLDPVTQQAELWMIATPDDAISACAQRLAALNINWQNTVIFHTSGLKTSVELAPLKLLGSSVASAHPAHSFANPERSLSRFATTVCTLEGDSTAINILTPLFIAIDGQVTQIEPDAKALYHAATVMASNYLVTLVNMSETLLKTAGMTNQLSRAILSPLMEQSLQNALSVGPVNAITGPIVRGDNQTVKAHLDALAQDLPEFSSVYKSLGVLTLQLAKQHPTHSVKRAAIEQLLLSGKTKTSI